MINFLGDAVFFIIGGILSRMGYIRIKKSRLISDIPTSKVRSVAMGLAELKGKARRKFTPLLESRLTRAPCVWFRFLIEVERRDSKGRTYWQKVDGGESSNYFYIEDETGKLLVDPLGAEVILPYDYRYVDLKGSLYNARKVRYTEWYIEEGDDIYVIGTVKKFRDEISEEKELLNERIRQLKSDSAKMKMIDTDGDGIVSPQEWDAAVERLKDKVLEEKIESINSYGDEYSAVVKDDIVVGSPERNHGGEDIFIISDRSEKDLCFRLSLGGYAAFIVGFCIIICSLFSMCGRLWGSGFLLPVIPWEGILSLILS